VHSRFDENSLVNLVEINSSFLRWFFHKEFQEFLEKFGIFYHLIEFMFAYRKELLVELCVPIKILLKLCKKIFLGSHVLL
jgi:hypothetical protein